MSGERFMRILCTLLVVAQLAAPAAAQQHGTWEPGPGSQSADTGPVPDCPNPGDVQTGDGSCIDPITQAAGAAGEVQYHASGAFAGDPDLAWDDGSKLLTIGAVTGTAGLKLPLQNDAVTPTLAWGDGDTGLFQRLDDRIGIALAGTPEWEIQRTVIGGWNCTEPIIGTSLGGSGGFGWQCSNAESLYRSGTADVRIKSGGTDVFGATATEATLYVEHVRTPQSRTCTDSGDANPGTLVASVSGSSLLEVTNMDPDGCDLILSETGATRGMEIRVYVVSTAGGTVDLGDIAGVQEVGAGCSMSLHGSATLDYLTTDRFALAACQPTN